MNYRVGLDYAHSTVYFDIGRTINFPDFNVVGICDVRVQRVSPKANIINIGRTPFRAGGNLLESCAAI